MVQRIIVEPRYGMFRACNHALTLERVSPSPTHPDPAPTDYFVKQLTRNSREYPRFYIFRTQLVATDASHTIDVILKIDLRGYDEVLVHEASIYETGALKGLVPEYYGLFEAEVLLDLDPTVSLKATCLVLEDCGDPIGNNLAELDRDFVADSVHQLVKFHEAGFRHGKLRSENLLHNREGRTLPIIIDLEYTEPHQCGRKIPMDIGRVAPWTSELGCVELLQFGEKTRIWLDEFVNFYGLSVSVWNIKSAEHLASMIHDEDVARCITKKVRLESARKIIRRLERQDHPHFNPDPSWQPSEEPESESKATG